ncbi:auxin transporter-like protein 1 [Selaginella moellendorffii]|uniref:auxin transporter-like protein 1 n=1 Tax=Selaginella moellendorffii TaxID=88036 RepID=UPI000D1C2306|nr:auxin transporter-like protein 1 [Selaginella moellendorffii]|eukprot:XP_024526150.1 auxin transporter-like protein 1 [Selaginella moellendorffii]
MESFCKDESTVGIEMQITNVEESNNFTAGRSIQEKITGAFLVGGSSFDAWLTTTTAQMLNYPNALAVLSPSKFRNVAIILMLTHQFIEFSAFVVPVFAMWEKLLGIHCSQNYTLKCIARMPIVLGICFLAIMLPFFGSINSVVGAIISSIGVYILPCLAFMVIRRHKESRENAIEQPPFWIKSWVGVYCINLGLVLWVGIIGAGFGSWASMHNIMHKIAPPPLAGLRDQPCSGSAQPRTYRCHSLEDLSVQPGHKLEMARAPAPAYIFNTLL